MGDLDGKVAIVTGAGVGSARPSPRCSVAKGAKVVVASRTPATVETVSPRSSPRATPPSGCPPTSRKEDSLEHGRQGRRGLRHRRHPGQQRPGVRHEDKPRASTIPTPMEDTDDAEWEYTFRTGATATLWGMQAVFPYMKEHGGKIINFSSGSGMEGFPGNTPYNATKEAIRALTRTAAREWGEVRDLREHGEPVVAHRSLGELGGEQHRVRPRADGQDAARLPGRPEEDGAPWVVWLAGQGRRVRHRDDDHAQRWPPHALVMAFVSADPRSRCRAGFGQAESPWPPQPWMRSKSAEVM